MSNDIITIKQEHSIENVINKSRFIAHIKPVSSEDEAKAFINEIKQQHKEATHNCSAYTVGDQMNIQKANDDGEPSGTAGVPMLEILKKLDVHNYDLTGKLEYELASTTYFLRDTTYTDKVSYQIDVVQTEYDDFIAFLNKNTAGNFELHEADVKKLPFDIPTN